MSRAFLFVLLVSVLEIQAYAPKTITNSTGSGANDTVTVNPVNSEQLVESDWDSTGRQDDQDPVESSETTIYNGFQNFPEDDDEPSDSEEDSVDSEGPSEDAIPHSEHEEPRDIPTKPKYIAPGQWAKLARAKNVSQEDVPLKLLAQVRRTHTVRRLPQRKAIENAESDEEKENAARLREVVRNSKVNTVYTEEGYEDSAYDHAGHIKDADFHEGYARKLHDQIDLKKKSEDDANKHGEEGADRFGNRKKTELEEFNDYDEDYREDYGPTTDSKRLVTSYGEDDDEWKDPKVVVEEGVETLQMDLEKEAEKMEKAEENLSSSEKNNSYYQKKERKIVGEQQKKPISSMEYTVDGEENSGKALEEWRVGRNDNNYVENYSTMRVPVMQNGITERVLYETTTSPEVYENSSNNPSVLYGYMVDGNFSPHIESIDFQPIENPSTINYSQLYWDYFKSRLNELTTMPPLASESKTSNPNLLTGNSYLEYGFSPMYREQTTPYPIIESSILNPQKLVAAPSLTNSKYLQTGQNNYIKSKDDIWQPIITTESPTTVRNQLLEIPNNDQTISLSDSIRNLASQESTRTFDNPLLNPVLSTLMGRKPRYKITTRQKPKKPTDSLSSLKQESSSPINGTPSESPVTVNDGYMKVLMHLRNEDNTKNRYSGVSQSSFLSSAHEPKDLTRMRPPAPQKPAEVGYQNFLPRKLVENESARSQSHGRANHRPPAHGNSSPGVKQTQSGRKRSSMPALDLLPPLASSESEYVKYKEANDYLTSRGNWLKQSINVARPFHPASIGIDAMGRVKRRERRNQGGREGSDESRGVVKVAEPSTNNAMPDRGEIDQSIKNRRMKRNLRRAATDVEVGAAIDKLSVQKNSRSSAIDRGTGFLQSRWKSIAEERERPRGLGLKESLGKSDSQGSSAGTTEVRERSVKKRSVYHERKHEELLDQSPKITDDIINSEIEARFNGDQKSEDEEKKVLVEVPDFDYAQELPEEYTSENVTSPEPTLNSKKYPFYKDERLPSPSALRYAMDPGRIPTKTYGGMEFYNSRNAYKHCAEIEPKLNVLPKKEQPVAKRGFNENMPRIRGLGDKLDCYKAKYFDEDPFDNPLFLEKEVEDPTPLADFDTKQFASRIMLFPKKDDDRVAQKSSKRPESYSIQRKPDSTKASSATVQKPRRIRYKTYQKTVRPSRPRIYRVRSSKTRYVKARRPQKVIRRPIGSASEVSSFYMPYQNQVYEDVMGTIKNMASSYQVHETTTTSSSDETGVTDGGILSSKEDKTNATVGATSREEKRNDTVLVNIVEHPNKNVDSSIQGLKPPKYSNRHQTIYKRNRAAQNGRIRVQAAQIPLTNHRVVNYRKKIRIYKRDASDEEDQPSVEITSLEENRSVEMVTESFEDVANSTTESTSIPYQESTTVAPVMKSAVSKKKTKVPKTISASSEKDSKSETLKKVVYTIRDRIRHSKPKGEAMKVGKFVNETKVEENTRRKEPKYNYIRRRKPSTSASTGPEVFLSNSTNETDRGKLVVVPKTTNESLKVSNEELAKENREIQYIVNNTETEQLNSSKEPANHSKKASIELSESQTSNKPGNNYAVHENVNETNVQESPELTRLKTFLDSDSSRYSGISSEDLKTSYVPQSNNSKDFIANLESIDLKESNEKQDDDNASKSNNKGYSSDEESSEKLETNGKDQPNLEFSEEANTSSKGSDSEEDKTFFSYASRPTSPAENYEDEKYSDLGPRVNKPEFFHPRFSFSSYTKSEPKTSSEDYSKEIEESDEEKEEYVFPWYKNKEDIERKRSRHRIKSIGDYEFPWERRERLAREKRKNEKKRKRLAKSLEDEEDEDASTRKYRRNTYPRGKYRFWSRMEDNSSEEGLSDVSDNVESSSVTKPVMKYSSRYNSKNGTLPSSEKSTNVRFRTVEEISRSIKKALEGDSKESLKEKKFSGSEKHKSSKGIVPENVTLPSVKKNDKKEIIEPLAPNSTDVITGRNFLKTVEEKGFGNSSSSTNSSLDNSMSRFTLVKANGAINSTRQSNKKRRRPLKNIVPLVESATKSAVEVNRNRRKQKLDATTVDTIISSSSTTPASMIVRRKQSKSVKDLKKKPDPVINDKIKDRDSNQTETSVLKNTAVKHRFRKPVESNKRRSSETIEKSNESKNSKDEKFVENGSMNKDNLSKHSDNQRKSLNNDSVKAKLKTEERLDHDVKQTEGTELEGKSPFFEDKDESFDSKGNSNFDRSDITDKDSVSEFGGVLKSDIRFKDSLPRTDTATPAKSVRIETNKGSGNISGQKGYNGGKSVKIELLQDQAEEGKGNGNNIEEKKRESNAKFVKELEQRLSLRRTS